MSKCCDNETQCESSCSSESCRPSCAASAEECPLDCAAEKWQDSFCKAMTAAQVEILKAKILKAHGPMLEQAADAFLEAAMACWQTQIAKVRAAEAAEGFKEKLHDLWVSDKKK